MVSRDTCIELLEQFIFDEDRIMTLKVLSQELDMHVNIAKQYMSDFFKIQKSKNVSLQVTYFLAGVSEEDGRKMMKVQIVSEDNLEEVKKQLNVTSCHIHSISKSKVDKCSLLSTEKGCNENGELNKFFGIKHPTIETKPVVLKKINAKSDAKSGISNQVSNSVKNGSSNKKESSETVIKCADNIKPKTCEVKESEKESEKNKVSSKNQKSNPLASMWQKKEEKSKEPKNENSKPETKGKNKSPGSSKNVPVKNSIMSMFSKQTAKNSENSKKEVNKPPETKTEIKQVTPEPKIKDVPKSVQAKKSCQQIPVKASSSKRKSSSRSKKSKLKSNSESDEEFEKPKKKKHRRICTFDDSDSESENEEAQDKAQRHLLESEEPVESAKNQPTPMDLTDDEEPIPPTPQNTTKGRKRIWKTVQKTFKDEDGFLITKQQKELVSASESDDESPIPKNSKETTKQNVFSYKKQSSLTSFFK